jgi:hypothetical protein
VTRLDHWEATRDALRAKLASEVGDTLDPNELDDLARTLTNTAIEAYTKSIFKGFKPTPRDFGAV